MKELLLVAANDTTRRGSNLTGRDMSLGPIEHTRRKFEAIFAESNVLTLFDFVDFVSVNKSSFRAAGTVPGCTTKRSFCSVMLQAS